MLSPFVIDFPCFLWEQADIDEGDQLGHMEGIGVETL